MATAGIPDAAGPSEPSIDQLTPLPVQAVQQQQDPQLVSSHAAAAPLPTRQGMIILQQPSGLPLALMPVKTPAVGVKVIRIPRGQGKFASHVLF